MVAVAAGSNHCLAITGNGRVKAFGTISAVQGETNVPANLSNVVAVAADMGVSLAVKSDGTWVGWGRNNYLQVTNIPYIHNLVDIAAGRWNVVALKDDGTLIRWGNNSFGCLHYSQGKVVAISSAGDERLFLTSDGRVHGYWGSILGFSSKPVPAELTNIVSICAGPTRNAALRRDGTAVWWDAGFTNLNELPAGQSNVVAVGVTAGATVLAIIPNHAPTANAQTSSELFNSGQEIRLAGSDPEDGILRYTIVSLPATGQLLQSGDIPITAPFTPLGDSVSVYFVPDPDTSGSPYASFDYVVDDGFVASAPATVTLNVIGPDVPQFTHLSLSREDGTFTLDFTGSSGVNYSIWASTNLVDWDFQGPASEVSNSLFEYVEADRSIWPQRFYRVRWP